MVPKLPIGILRSLAKFWLVGIGLGVGAWVATAGRRHRHRLSTTVLADLGATWWFQLKVREGILRSPA